MSKFFKWFNKDKNEQQDASRDIPEQASPTDVSDSSSVVATNASVPDEDVNEVTGQASELPEPVTEPISALPQGNPIEGDAGSQDASLSKEVSTAAANDVVPVAEQPLSAEKPPENEDAPETLVSTNTSEASESHGDEEANLGFFSKLKRSLSKTKENIGSGFVSLFKGKSIDDELYEELETQLLVADLGMDTTNRIINELTESASRKALKDGEALYELLKTQMADILHGVSEPLNVDKSEGPFAILMVGVNGVGKTTTIGKMAKQFQLQGKKVMLAAGDTFRAAAVEQLQVWGERNDIPVVAQQTGSDSASVIFDAYQSAKAKNVDVLIADTAGRLQNKDHLMEELKKVVRVLKKIDANAPHEIMLTLDAGTGQNAVSQTKLFNEAVGLTGITLTKLDGTAKGGVIFAIADHVKVPIRYIGIGEGIDDLRPFESQQFVDALFQDAQQ